MTLPLPFFSQTESVKERTPVVNAETAALVLRRTPRRALFALVFAGLLVVPRLCPAGHAWKATDSETYTCFHCKRYAVAE
eukprot:1578879-Alexandrium_andersonii.AAC.1